MTSQYDMFFYWLGEKESGDLKNPGRVSPQTQYRRINEAGYLGKYQMGEQILKDNGYYNFRGDPAQDNTRIQDWKGQWTGKRGINSIDDFINSPSAQEYAIRESMRQRWQAIHAAGLDKFVGTNFRGVRVTESGLLAGAHLVGVGRDNGLKRTNRGLVAMFLYNKTVRDGNKVDAMFYIQTFGGYQTPFDLNPTLSHVQAEFSEYIRRGKKPSLNSQLDSIPREVPTHYIWRSQDDAKVRPAHVANDDQIFAVDGEPQPEGGLMPREDYNCRCWAEWLLNSDYPLEP